MNLHILRQAIHSSNEDTAGTSLQCRSGGSTKHPSWRFAAPMSSAFLEHRWHQVVNKVHPLEPRPLSSLQAMEYPSEPRARTTSLTRPPTSLSTTSGHDTPVLRPRRSIASVQSRGYVWPGLQLTKCTYLTFHSPVPILGPLTFSLLSHEDITSCNNMRHIG